MINIKGNNSQEILNYIATLAYAHANTIGLVWLIVPNESAKKEVEKIIVHHKIRITSYTSFLKGDRRSAIPQENLLIIIGYDQMSEQEGDPIKVLLSRYCAWGFEPKLIASSKYK